MNVPRGACRIQRHDVAERIADEDVVEAVAIEIGDRDVRDLRPLLAAWRIADRP